MSIYITKLGHSSVYVASEEKSALFDPGGWADRELINAVTAVDEIVYTHEHGDHFDVDILASLIQKFPDAIVVCNTEIQKKIREAGLHPTMVERSDATESFSSPHEALPLPGVQAPSENGYHFVDMFTHPGDSQHFYETKKVLAMPFIGPWGKTGDSIQKVLELKPAYVLPIHDWHYTEEAKLWLQGLLEAAFAESGIQLLENKNGMTQTVE